MFLFFITIYGYIYLAHFFINSKYLEINIRSAEVNTTKEFIANLPAFQKFVIFFILSLRNSSYSYLLVQYWIIFIIHNHHHWASNSCLIVVGDFLFCCVSHYVAKLRKVVSPLSLKHVKNVKQLLINF